MRVLVACEFSGTVREAFRKRGHDAWSCDLIDTEIPGKHIIGDVLQYLNEGWDLMIAHPPCTYLAASGSRWMLNNPERWQARVDALNFVKALLDADIPKIALENPISVISSHIRKPDQIIHPWQFGHEEEKQTCLWLKNLPLLTPTDIKENFEQKIWKKSALRGPGSSKTRQQDRSRTYQGIADAMAEQWGCQ